MAQPDSAEHRLHRPLGLRDLVLAQILCVVGSSWVGVAGGLGPAQSLTWVAAMVLFYVPMAASVICLNRRMPLEGGLYVWAREAFGDLGGFLTAWNLWVYGIAVTATILYAIPTELSYLIGPAAAWLPENRLAALGIVTALLAAIMFAALRGLELGKWIHNIGGIAMLIVFAGLIVLPLWAWAHHAPLRYTPFSIAAPQVNMRSLALFGQMLFGALCGLEYIAILAGESRDPARSIGQSVIVSSPVICAMFILGTASIVALVPRARIDFIAPIPQVMRLTLGATGLGNVAAIAAIFLLQLRLLGATSYLFTGVTRLPMAAGWNHLVPEWFTRLHPRRRTPTNSIACVAALVFALVILASTGVHAQEAYQLLTNASLTHYEVAYLAMFAVPLFGAAALRRSLPRWLKWTSVAGFLSTLFSLLISAYPFVTVVNARIYAIKILSTLVVSNLIAVGFY
ncbi:MAG: APC family permease, partial [Acidobacteriaceae bacterium]